MDSPALPSSTTRPPRTYLVSGSLGAVLFVASWWFDGSNDFVSSLFMELGGGAFIVFLLEFLLPSFLGYADGVVHSFWATRLVWSSRATEAFISLEVGDTELREFLTAVENARFPSWAWSSKATATGASYDGHRILAITVPVGPTEVRYCVTARRRRGYRRTATIVDIVRSGSRH